MGWLLFLLAGYTSIFRLAALLKSVPPQDRGCLLLSIVGKIFPLVSQQQEDLVHRIRYNLWGLPEFPGPAHAFSVLFLIAALTFSIKANASASSVIFNS